MSTHKEPNRLIADSFPAIIFWYYLDMKHNFNIISYFLVRYLMQFLYSPAFVKSVDTF